VTHVAVFSWDGKDFPPRFNGNAAASRRDSHVRQTIADIVPTRHHPWKIPSRGDVHNVFFAGSGIEFMNVTGLLEYNRAFPGIHGLHIEIGELRHLRKFLGPALVRPNIS